MKRAAILFAVMLGLIVMLANCGSTVIFEWLKLVPWGDKILHFVLIGFFAFLVNMSMNATSFRIGRIVLLKGSLIVALLATIEEFSQLVISTRNYSVSDLVADYAGILCFGSVALYLTRRKETR